MQTRNNRQLVVARQMQEKAEITVYFKANQPEASELLALRPCHPGFRQLEPAKIRKSIGDTGRLRILDLNGAEAHELLIKLRKVGFRASLMTNSVDRYVPFDRFTCEPLPTDEGSHLTGEILEAGLHLGA